MEYSPNYGLNLPSRDNDTDIVDINQLSTNFRIIDRELAKTASKESVEEVKNNLSNTENAVSNINREVHNLAETKQNKLSAGNGITIENDVISSTGGGGGGGSVIVDQTYKPESVNPQSGIAVAEAIKNKANLEEIVFFGFLSTEIFPDDFQEYIGYAVVENVARVDNAICFEYRKADTEYYPLKALYLATNFDNSVFDLKYGESVYVDGDGQTVRITKFKDVADKQDKLKAGNGIVIENNIISSTGGGGSGGKDGVSPTVEVTETTNGHNVSITDVNGTKSFEVQNGKDGKDGHTPKKNVDYFDGKNGSDGTDGKDGYTPIKGVDYYTEADKAEIVDELKNSAPVKSVNGKTGAVSLSATDVGARPSTWMPTYTEVGADKSGTAVSVVGTHNTNTDAHNDIRLLISGLSSRLDALANSDDTTLDQMAEVVAYIKANRDLIEQITTGKVSVADIVDNLTTNVSNKPLSASQGVALKKLIDAIVVPTKLADLSGDTTHRTVTDTEKSTWNAKSDFSGAYGDLTGKPTIPTVPTKVSAFENDKGYLTEHQSLSGYATETYVKNYAQPKGNYLTSHQDISGKADKSSAETWTFTLEDGSTVTKKVVLA